MPMKIGISRPTFEGETNLEVVRAAADHGLSGVQFKPVQYKAYVENPEAFKDTYGPLSSLAAGGIIAYPGADLSAWKLHIRPLVDFCNAIGAPHICVCANVGRDISYGQLADLFNGLGREALAKGVVLSLHNHQGSLFETGEDFDQLIPLLDPSCCGITLDTGHTAKAGISDPAALVERFAERIFNVHLKDFDSEGAFCLPGTGTVDLDAVVDRLIAVEFDQWLILDEETRGADIPTAFGAVTTFLKGRGLIPV